MRTFANLLNPISPSDFIDQYWTQKAIIISDNNPKKFADLFSWESLNQILNLYPLKSPEIRLSQSGKKFQPIQTAQDIIQSCQSGATLVVDCLHQKNENIAKLAEQLRLELGHRIQVNSYSSPGEQQGFTCHYDSHEVFILQISGQKHWRVFPESFPYPTSETPSSQFTPPETNPYLEQTLNPGELLYIPRGHWHYAIAAAEPSLHLTLGIDGPTGIDFSDWLTEQLQTSPQWRQTLPFLNINYRSACREHLQQLIETWREKIEQDNLIERYLDEQYLKGQPSRQFSFPAQLSHPQFPNGLLTQFYRPQQPVLIETNPNIEGYTLKTGEKKIALSGLEFSSLEKIFTAENFTGLDVQNWLADFDWDTEIIPLLTQLVQNGILLVVTS
jgi:ribosomal protein L16 Arg81 hydroxylase